MTKLEFIAALVNSAAWPSATVAIAFGLRKEAAGLIRSLAKLKFRDLELEFGRLRDAAEEVPEPPPTNRAVGPELVVQRTLEQQVQDIAPLSPAGAILVAWTGVETAIFASVNRMAISPDPPQYRSVMHCLDQLLQEGKISPAIRRTIDQLRTLRNQVAHNTYAADNLSADNASEYGRTASKVIRTLDSLPR